ncbi:MAG TPA: TrbC/VirB2 family protein [Polyangiaceae bacterium]|nr:TrbC/VirB2 family protein [Polyangiaceae bacterium]
MHTSIVRRLGTARVRAALTQIATVAMLAVASTSTAHSAGTSGMPWEGPLNQLLDSLTGPVSRVIGAVAIIGLGVSIAFSEGGSMMRRALWVVLGLAIAFNAVSWGLSFLGFSGGLVV